MELFVASIISHKAKLIYDQYHEIRAFGTNNSPFQVINDRRTDPSLIAITEEVLKACPHKPSLVEILDIRGSLQTASQFTLRSIYKMYKNFFQTKCRTHYKRELVYLPDGGNIALDWVVCPNHTDDDIKSLDDENIPIVLMLHGLLGDSQSEYMYHFAKKIKAASYQPVMYVARGCGDLELTSGYTFGGSITADLYYAIKKLRSKYPKRQFFMVGYSLGAAVTLNYLGNTTDYSEITAALSICPPWNIVNTIQRPSKLFAIWSFLLSLPAKIYFWKHYKNLLKYNPELIKSVNFWRIILAKTMSEFDSLIYPIYFKHIPIITEKILENNENNEKNEKNVEFYIDWKKESYKDSNDYYSDGSPIFFSEKVKVPTVVINAMDDPICPVEDCPCPENKNTHLLGEKIAVVKTNFGGHLAFAEHSVTHAWTDDFILGYFEKFR